MSLELLISNIDEILGTAPIDDLLGADRIPGVIVTEPPVSEQTDLQLVRMLARYVLELVQKERREHGDQTRALEQRLRAALRRVKRAEVYGNELEKELLGNKEVLRLALEEANAASFTEAAEGDPLPFK